MSGFAGVIALDARDGAEILVDRAKVVIREMAEIGPGHYLQKVPVERWRDAVCVRRSGAWWMQLIGIDACADGVPELFKGVAANREATGVGRKVARDDVGRAGDHWAEVSAAAEIGCWIGVFRLMEVWIAAGRVLGLRTSGVTAIAVASDVDEVTAEADEGHVLTSCVEGDGCGIKADLDAGIAVLFFSCCARRSSGCCDRDGRNNGAYAGDLKQAGPGHEIFLSGKVK